MSTWNLGINDVSEETHALRNKLSSKEGQIAAQQDRLVQQAAEIQELNNTLNEAFHKLSNETERALQLEEDVKQRSEDLRNEQIALQNLQAALSAAHGKVEDNSLETRNLQATLEAISLTSDEHKARGDRLEREKSRLDARVKELESELREAPQHTERLLAAINRLRGERDSLRRDVQFLESESRFTIEALEAKLSASVSSTSDKTVATIGQLKNEMDELHSRLAEISEKNAATVESKNFEIKRLGLVAQTLAVVFNHSSSQATINTEDRYTSLQFHQLSNLTSNEATRNLRGQIEELENRVMRRTEQIGIHQHDIKRLEINLRLQEERLGEMTTELEMMAAQKDAMVEDCADARETRDEALMRVEQLEEELEGSEGRNIDNTVIVESLIATIAQTVCQAREAIRLSREEVAEARDSHGQQSAAIQQLQEKETAFHKSIQEYQNEIQTLATTLSQCQMEVEHVSALATKVQRENCELVSQLENGNLQVQDHETTINDLRRLNQELRNSLQEHQLSKPDADDAERNLVQLKLEHAEAIGVLQARLVETSSDLEEAQTRYISAQDAHQRTIQEANSSNLELEQRLGAASEKLAELEQLREQYNDLKKEHAKQQSLLQEELTKASHSYQDLQRSRDALEDERVRLTEDLTRIQKEHAIQVNRSRDENRAVKQELEQQITSLQGRIEEQDRLLDISKREASRICDRLQEEVEVRAQDEKQHATALVSERERNDKTISQLRGELETLKRNLQQTNVDLQSAEDEKLTLQQQMTALQAEIQRSKSLSHYLEIQTKDSDQMVTTLKGDIERAEADLARSEKSWKAAEVNLSLQNAQHKREMTELQRELSAFRSGPNLEQALAELEERNSEMEELLRNKCMEIEENDDRALEMLKEKKKLTTKVESLTRKVQNLQAKLAAAKASNAVQEPQPTPTLPVPSLPLTSPIPHAPTSRPRSATVSSVPPIYPPAIETPTLTTRNPPNRVVSGPSFLPRPKTPETRTITPVFKARTPERQMRPEVVSIPPVPVIGKKRAAPDDFEAYLNLPAQAFTADGEDIENKTPRVRKALNSLQPGFTPVRNQSGRPTVPSPRRGTSSRTSPFISDLTNSPHQLAQMNLSSTKPSKRSWLGKIRGNSQATDRPPGMRSLFDRGEIS